jgi:hypothetical protein
VGYFRDPEEDREHPGYPYPNMSDEGKRAFDETLAAAEAAGRPVGEVRNPFVAQPKPRTSDNARVRSAVAQEASRPTRKKTSSYGGLMGIGHEGTYEGSRLQRTPEQNAQKAAFVPSALSSADKSQARRERQDRYGYYGSPWGNVPPELEDHLRSQQGLNATALRIKAGVEMGAYDADAEVSELWDENNNAIQGKGAGWNYTEESPGNWIWTGWENDPEYIAWKEGRTRHRRESARGMMQQGRTATGPTMAGSGAMSQLEALFAAGDVGAE